MRRRHQNPIAGKRRLTRAAALSALVLLGARASAQNQTLGQVLGQTLGQAPGQASLSTSLPLTSVGEGLSWSVGDQALHLDVPVSGLVRLELYSPRLDPADYRSDRYYGDEAYEPPGSTTFRLIAGDGQEVLRQTFTPGAHRWETLLDRELPAGRYQLQTSTEGQGKNTFTLRLSGVSASVSAETLSVNVHAQRWLPALRVSTSGPGFVLRMYDGDGPQELEARLVGSDGRIYPLSVSGDLAWNDLPLPDQAGAYTVELRQPDRTQQFSNTVSFALQQQGSPRPLTLSRVDRTGRLRVTAEVLLPIHKEPTSLETTWGSQAQTVDGLLEKTVPPGEHRLEVPAIPGAEVRVYPERVGVPENGLGVAYVQVRPQVQLSLEADKTEVCVGDTVTLTARASTAYKGTLPLELDLDPGSLTGDGPTSRQGSFSASEPAELRFTGKATQAGNFSVSARLGPWGQFRTQNIRVRPDLAAVQLSREPLPPLEPGDEVRVRLSLKNTSGQLQPFALEDRLPSGMEALEPARFVGTLAPDETRVLSYRAKARTAGEGQFQATLQKGEGCGVHQTVGGPVQVKAPEVRSAPSVQRRSTVQLPFDAPAEAERLIVVHTLPEGASYVPASSRLNGEPTPDPQRGASGRLYWTLPSTPRGLLSYQLNHAEALGALPAPSLIALFPGERPELLVGEFEAKDWAAATPLLTQPTQPVLAENPGAIKLPLDGSVLRIRDRINVVVEVPQGPIPPLTVNGQTVPPEQIGTNTQDGTRKVQRLTYVGVPIRPGSNELRVLDQLVQVRLVGGTAKLEVIPLDTVANGSTPLRFKIRALDLSGELSAQSSVTLRSSLEPRQPDANPTETGYQLRLTDGEGILELQPQPSPVSLQLDLETPRGGEFQTYRYEITPDQNRVMVGLLSATVGLQSPFSVANSLSWQAKLSLETPLAGGKLYLAADKDGLPNDQNILIRYPLHGDASQGHAPLQGIDPVAVTYDHPRFRADYRRHSMPIDVLPVGERLTALSVSTKSNPSVSTFAALVPKDRVSDLPLTPQGTRLLRLPDQGIDLGSETLVLVTLERGTRKELKREVLNRNVDYVLDIETGIIVLTRALDRLDQGLNERVVYASYRLQNPLSQRQLAYGAQVKYSGGPYTIGAAAVTLDGRTTFGVKANYDQGSLRAEGLVAYSGGLQASASMDYSPAGGNLSFGAKVRYQDDQYRGLGPLGRGLSLGANASVKLNQRLTAVLESGYQQTPPAKAGEKGTQSGNLGVRLDYQWAPFTVGAGLRYTFGDQQGLSALGRVGYQRDPWTVDLTHSQPLSGTIPASSEIGVRYRLGKNLILGLTDKVTWGVGHLAVLSLDSQVGNVNYAVSYELPDAAGAGNRARFGVGTTLALNARTQLGLRGSAAYSIAAQKGEASVGADLQYRQEHWNATLGTDLVYNDQGFGAVFRGGVTGRLTEALTVSADALAEFGGGKNGQRFSVGYAYRAGAWNSLGSVRYVQGSLAGTKPELSTGFGVEYWQPGYALQAGLETRTLLLDPGSFTMQASLGGTYFLNDRFGLGAWGRFIAQPSSATTQVGFGVEASARVLPGFWLSLGYNPLGFNGLGHQYTRQGLYLRLDLVVDERSLEQGTGGRK